MPPVMFSLSRSPRPGVNLVVEGRPDEALDIFGEIVADGTRGLFISEEKMPPHHVKPSDTRVRYLWFAKMGLSAFDGDMALAAGIGEKIRAFIDESGGGIVMVDKIPRLLGQGNLAFLAALFESVSTYSEKKGVAVVIPVSIPAMKRGDTAAGEMEGRDIRSSRLSASGAPHSSSRISDRLAEAAAPGRSAVRSATSVLCAYCGTPAASGGRMRCRCTSWKATSGMKFGQAN